MSVASVDVLIIGGGVMGSSIAYHLARQGRPVLLIERSEIATTPAASWASAGGVRRQGRHPSEAKLASEAIARWPTLEQELDADMQYRQGGNLLLAETDDEAEQLATFVRHQQEMGFSDVHLLDSQDVHGLIPGLSERVVAGSYSPEDGQADPASTTRAFALAAQRHGATIWERTAVRDIRLHSRRGALTERGEVQADQIVLAAGAWSDEIAAPLGLLLPIRTRALQMVLSTPAPRGLLAPVVSALGRSLSLKQLRDGAFLLGGGWLGQPTPDKQGYTLHPENVEGNWRTASELFPAVGNQHIERAWCGLEAESIDMIPFIGPLPGYDGLTLALGFSGHGFALSPAVPTTCAMRYAPCSE